jgi:hypothetical protein
MWAAGKQLAHAAEVVLDDVEIDHQARRLGLLLSEIRKIRSVIAGGFPVN